MSWYAYILRSEKDNRLYKGIAQDPELRVIGHNKEDTKSTKGYRPWVLVYKEKFDNREEARAREKYFKSGSGREWLKTILDP